MKKESQVLEGAVDRVVAISRHVDGTPAQSPGFRSVDPETTAALSKAQLREQAASAVDHAHRSAAAESETSGKPDEEIAALKAAQESAADSAAAKVEKLD